MPHQLREELGRIVGPSYVADSDFCLWTYAKDSSGFPARIPGIIARPRTTQEICEIVKLANRRKVSIVPRGGGTAYGRSPGDQGKSICLDLTRMNDILEINELNRTVTVEAGITCSELETRLRSKGFYAHTVYGPADSVTVGGVVSGVAGAGAGQMFSAAGHNEPYVMGLKVVLPNGGIIETGSRTNVHAKMFAPVAHGPNLMGMFVGHMGIFGVITEVTLQIFPWPPFEKTGGVSYDYGRLDDAYQTLLRLAMHPDKPFSLLGLVGPGPEGLTPRSEWHIVYKVHGFSEADLASKLDIAARILAEDPAIVERDSVTIQRLTSIILKYPHDVMPRRIGMYNLLEPLVPRDETLRIVRAVLRKLAEEFTGWEARMKSGGTAVWVHGEQNYLSFPIYHDESDLEAREKATSVWKKTAAMCLELGANFTVLDKDIGDICAGHFTSDYRDLLTALKAALDPNNVMNPHLLGLP